MKAPNKTVTIPTHIKHFWTTTGLFGALIWILYVYQHLLMPANFPVNKARLYTVLRMKLIQERYHQPVQSKQNNQLWAHLEHICWGLWAALICNG